jgi:hypothetical protein
MAQVTNEDSDQVVPQRCPGYLMMPFGWAAKPLAAVLEADRSLYLALFTLSRRRMHLIALALSHWHGEIEASFARLLMLGVPSIVLDANWATSGPGYEWPARCRLNLALPGRTTSA